MFHKMRLHFHYHWDNPSVEAEDFFLPTNHNYKSESEASTFAVREEKQTTQKLLEKQMSKQINGTLCLRSKLCSL